MKKVVTEAKKRANAKYDKNNTRQIMLKLNLNTDKEILDHLDRQNNRQGYIKRLIREDMERQR